MQIWYLVYVLIDKIVSIWNEIAQLCRWLGVHSDEKLYFAVSVCVCWFVFLGLAYAANRFQALSPAKLASRKPRMAFVPEPIKPNLNNQHLKL